MLPRPEGGAATAMIVHLLAQNGEQTGNPLAAFALPLLLLVGFYFLLIRPQRNRQRQQQALVAALEVGDEVMTTGGIFGTIVEIDDDEGVLTVEIAPGTRIRMLRQGIAQRFVQDEGEDLDDEEGGSVDEEADRKP
jgi:preprotein translocase subunit YajC